MNARTLLTTVAAVVVGGLLANVNVQNVADGTTYTLDLADDLNKAACVYADGTLLNLGSGCTVRLSGTPANAGEDFELKVGIRCGGDFVIDGSGLDGNFSKTLRWSGAALGGRAVLKGFDRLVFGNSTVVKPADIRILYFESDVAFDPSVANPQGVLFTHNMVVARTPSSTTWSIDDGALVWPLNACMMGTDPATPFSAAGFGVGLVVTNSLVNRKVTVGADGLVAFRPCSIWNHADQSKIGDWGGLANYRISCDVELNDPGARIQSVTTQKNCTLDGEISGSGYLILTAQGETVLTGPLIYTGVTVLGGKSASLTVKASAMATSSIDMSNSLNVVRFTAPTTTVNRIYSTTYCNSVVLPDDGVLRVGSLAGLMSFTNTAGTVIVDSLESSAKIQVNDRVKLIVKSTSAAAWVIAAEATAYFGVPESGPSPNIKLCQPNTELHILEGAYSFREGDNNYYENIARVVAHGTATVTLDGPWQGQVREGGTLVHTSMFNRKLAYWGDADKRSTILLATDLCPTAEISSPNTPIMVWTDRRGGGFEYMFATTRFATNNIDGANGVKKYPTMPPQYRTNVLNGRAVVDFIDSLSGRMGLWHGPFNWIGNVSRGNHPTIDSQYAITVATKAQSGGITMLGDLDYRLSRPSFTYAGLFSNENVVVHRDGALVASPTTTPYVANQYQIYSYTTDGAKILGLATDDPNSNNSNGSHSGGFNFGEVMVFTEAPTDAERVSIENYLSEKWGIPVSHAGAACASNVLDVAGSGTMTLTEPFVTGFDGPCQGTVTVNDPFSESTRSYSLAEVGSPVTVTHVAMDAAGKKFVIDFTVSESARKGMTYQLFGDLDDTETYEIGQVDKPARYDCSVFRRDGKLYVHVSNGFRLLLR